MGHISNAKAYRLGWSLDWADSFYLTRRYYTLYFFIFLKIRLFFASYFKANIYERSGTIFSHVRLYKKGVFFGIQLFLYSSLFENWVKDFSTEFFEFIQKKTVRYFADKRLNIRNKVLNLKSRFFNLDKHCSKIEKKIVQSKFYRRNNINSLLTLKFYLNPLINYKNLNQVSINYYYCNLLNLVELNYLNLIQKRSFIFNKIINIKFLRQYKLNFNKMFKWNLYLRFLNINNFNLLKKKAPFKILSFINKLNYSLSQVKKVIQKNLNFCNKKNLNFKASTFVINKSVNMKTFSRVFVILGHSERKKKQINYINLLFKRKLNMVTDLILGSWKTSSKVNLFLKLKNSYFKLRKTPIFKLRKKSIKFNVKVNYFILMYIYIFSFISGFKFNSKFDWKNLNIFLINLQTKNFMNIYNFFIARSLFSIKSVRYNLNSVTFLFSLFKKFDKLNFLTIFDDFLTEFYFDNFMKPVIKLRWFFLRSWLYLLIGHNNFKGEYYLINNTTVNAAFLAKFIAKSLQYKHTVKGILAPVKDELLKLADVSVITIKSKLLNVVNILKFNKQNKNFWRVFLSFLLVNFDSSIISYFSFTNLWYSLDLFSFLMSIYSSKFRDNTSKIHYYYFNRRAAFYCLFIYNYKADWTIKISNLKNLNIFYCNDFSLNFLKFFKFMFIDFFINERSLFLFKSILIPNYNLIKLGIIHYSKFFKFMYKSAIFLSQKGGGFLNVFKERIEKKPNSEYLGFKISFVGRFSRKQRAASYWISTGRVPLTQVQAKIDYGHSAVSLKNSAVNVKIWLYNNTFNGHQYFKKIY